MLRLVTCTILMGGGGTKENGEERGKDQGRREGRSERGRRREEGVQIGEEKEIPSCQHVYCTSNPYQQH